MIVSRLALGEPSRIKLLVMSATAEGEVITKFLGLDTAGAQVELLDMGPD